MFEVSFDPQKGTLITLKRPGDAYDTNFLSQAGLGRVEFAYRVGGGAWEQAETEYSENENAFRDRGNAAQVPGGSRTVQAAFRLGSAGRAGEHAFRLTSTFQDCGEYLDWTLHVRNDTHLHLEIGDLRLPLYFSTDYVQDPEVTYTQRVVRHSFISGEGSFILLTRPNGVPPFLLMTPRAGTKLEYFQQGPPQGAWEGKYQVFIHSLAAGSLEDRGTWRQPHTSLRLAPKGEPGDSITYGFRFRWAESYERARDILYEESLFDIQVVPGMSVPVDLFAKVAVRTKNPGLSLLAEFPQETTITPAGEKNDTHIFQVRFARLGENRITLQSENGKRVFLEFFVTEPVETLIKKRAAFLVKNQQVKNPALWYNGLFALWDMKDARRYTPDDLGGLAHAYMAGGSDDPTLCKAPFIATKNLSFPVREEIAAVEYYLEHFVWGKLQRTGQETPYPYGIYGVDNWYANRNSEIGFESGGRGQEHLWRTFDYPHLFLLYFNMYRIARLYPELVQYLDQRGYLTRAFGTALAFFLVPNSIKMGEPFFLKGYSDWAYKQGNFGELVIPELIKALEAEGMQQEADALRAEWEKKVKYFAYDHPYPYGSEMFFDSTGFESTHRIAKYGLETEMQPDEKLWYDKNKQVWYSHPNISREDFKRFMEHEIAANIAARGWLENSYYWLGSDYRQHGSSDYTLSYMTQMGGWAIVDYALYYSTEPATYLRLGYAAYLGPWALINTGTKESQYGFWHPGEENDGAAGWAFKPEKYGPTWMGIAQGRGIWQVDGEIDAGFSGGLRTAAAIVVEDPLFGLFCYGGEVEETRQDYRVVLRDGLRQRLHLLAGAAPLRLNLERDGFSQAPVILTKDRRAVGFTLENRTQTAHRTQLKISGLEPGQYVVEINGAVLSPAAVVNQDEHIMELPVKAAPFSEITIKKHEVRSR